MALNQEDLCPVCSGPLAGGEPVHEACSVIASARRRIADAWTQVERSMILLEASRALLARPLNSPRRSVERVAELGRIKVRTKGDERPSSNCWDSCRPQ